MSRRASPVGPVVMIVPLLSLIAGALWMRGRVASGSPPGAPYVIDPDARVAGWRTAEDNGVAVAELFPLHAQPERQAFEAERLAERLDLGPGEPFRLRLAQADPQRVLDPSSLAVRVGGTIMLDVVRPGPAARSGPLAALIAPPATLDPHGRIVEIVLWGRAPQAPPILLVRAGSDALLELPLEPLERPQRDLPAFLARLDPAESGKESSDSASDEGATEASASDLRTDDER